MPTDQGSLHTVNQRFHYSANFPNVIGAVDGTHGRIKSPAVDEDLYMNRKNNHSPNVMEVCDSIWSF